MRVWSPVKSSHLHIEEEKNTVVVKDPHYSIPRVSVLCLNFDNYRFRKVHRGTMEGPVVSCSVFVVLVWMNLMWCSMAYFNKQLDVVCG